MREHSTHLTYNPSKHHPTWGLFGPICSCLTGWTPADTNFWCCGGGMLRSALPWTDGFTSASRRPQLLFQYWYLITPGAVAPKIVGVPASLVQSCPDRRWCMLLLSAHCKIPCQFFITTRVSHAHRRTQYVCYWWYILRLLLSTAIYRGTFANYLGGPSV